jgi:hypothetical protein
MDCHPVTSRAAPTTAGAVPSPKVRAEPHIPSTLPVRPSLTFWLMSG